MVSWNSIESNKVVVVGELGVMSPNHHSNLSGKPLKRMKRSVSVHGLVEFGS